MLRATNSPRHGLNSVGSHDLGQPGIRHANAVHADEPGQGSHQHRDDAAEEARSRQRPDQPKISVGTQGWRPGGSGGIAHHATEHLVGVELAAETLGHMVEAPSLLAVS